MSVAFSDRLACGKVCKFSVKLIRLRGFCRHLIFLWVKINFAFQG
jgi:hypothetical protein